MKNIRHRRGDVREDGKVFWQYFSDGREYWASPEKIKELRERDLKNQSRLLSNNRECVNLKRRERYSRRSKHFSLQRRNWRSQNTERERDVRKAWREKNPEQTGAHNARRRSATSIKNLDQTDRNIIREIYLCRTRISKCTGISFHVDHIIPLVLGGRHVPGNLQILTAKLNQQKSDRLSLT